MTKMATKDKKDLTLTVDVSMMDPFKEMLNILKDIISDKRIDVSLRNEYSSRIKKLIDLEGRTIVK